MRAHFDRGLRRVLIAGSQDAGLLALVTHAGAEHDVKITVLDVCETPLELCRRLADRWSLSVETIRQDLLDLTLDSKFDVVLVHGTLHFIAADRRIEALTRIQRAIRPGGQLILLFNTSPAVGVEKAARGDYGRLVVAELERLGVPLPDTELAMRERLDAHQHRRELREGAFAEPGEIELLLDAAGFNLKKRERIDVSVASPISKLLVEKVSKRRFMAVAEPKPAR